MSPPKYLIDTNVFIGLEDHAEVSPNFASLLQLTARFGVGVYIHAAAIDDINRDRDENRRRVSLSKIRKFPIIEKVIGLNHAALESQFGTLPRPNDVVDATLLHALDLGVADFLITEDQGLHERARRVSATLSDRVLYVADAVSLLRTTYEPIKVSLPAIKEVDAHTIPTSDPIFTSLRADYPPFDNWWREKCVKAMRKCWVVIDDGALAGLVVRKEERPNDTDASLAGDKILKVCTFKVRPESRGVKLGELLLKQILWYAQSNLYDVVYLTTFAAQSTLIDLLEYYGFFHTHSNQSEERVYEKALPRDRLEPEPGLSLFESARRNYPRFATGTRVRAYTIPIREEYHEILFPELVHPRQYSLFQSPAETGMQTPGNTIRKVYLCRARAQITQPGALLFFYKGRSTKEPSQSITTIGIFEEMALARSNEELRRLAGGRSVYSDNQLMAMAATTQRPIKVINFLLAGHLDPSISLYRLKSDNIFAAQPPQSIKHLEPSQLRAMLDHVHLGFAV